MEEEGKDGEPLHRLLPENYEENKGEAVDVDLEDPRMRPEEFEAAEDDFDELNEDDLRRINHEKRLFKDEDGSTVIEGNFVLNQGGRNDTIKC